MPRPTIAQLQRELSAAINTTAEVRSQYEQFKKDVREVALNAKQSENWCDQGFNAAMDELGLEKLPSEFEIDVEIKAVQTVTVTVDADDLVSNDYERTEQGARQYVLDQQLAVKRASLYDWDVKDEVEVKSSRTSTN